MGQDDVVAIAEMPDDITLGALSITIGASGAFSGGATTKLLTSAEARAAMTKATKAHYTPPTG